MRKVFTFLASIAALTAGAADNFTPVPTFTAGKEWVFVGDTNGDTLRIQCDVYPQDANYTSWNYTPMREDSTVVKSLTTDGGYRTGEYCMIDVYIDTASEVVYFD